MRERYYKRYEYQMTLRDITWKGGRGKASLVTLPYLYDDDGHKNQAAVKLPHSSGDARCTYLAVVGSTSERAKFYIIRRKAIASGSEVTSGLAALIMHH